MEARLTPLLSALLETKRIVYCASNLFSPMARIAAANLAGCLEVEIRRRLQIVGHHAYGEELIFLPYRDSDQALMSGADRAKRIYDADLAQLRRSAAVLARLDGLVKDSGVAMEIGYAHGLGVPVAVLITDFMGEGFVDTDVRWFLDPVVERMVTTVDVAADAPPMSTSYYQGNLLHENNAVSVFVHRCLDELPAPSFIASTDPPMSGTTVHVDIMGGRYEWARQQQHALCEALSNIGWSVTCATRFSASYDVKAFSKAIDCDIANVSGADALIISAAVQEPDAGCAALFGLALSHGKHRILLCSSNTLYAGSGGQMMRLNLMLEHAATVVTRSYSQTIQHCQSLLEI